VTQTNVGRIIDFHEIGGQALTMAVRRFFQQIPYGCVEVDRDELVGFVEKPTLSQLVNAGIYVVDPECLSLLPAPAPISMPDIVGRVQASGRKCKVFEIDDDWIDVGVTAELHRARHGE
jgi:NDP-sugar pyrophosphorylase family protein